MAGEESGSGGEGLEQRGRAPGWPRREAYMGNRSVATKQAVDESIGHVEPKTTPKKRQGEGAGSDLDRELTLYFSGGFKADAGLRSGIGNQLERMRYELSGGGGGTPSTDPPKCVQLGVSGPPAYSELWRVAAALTLMGESTVSVLAEADMEGDRGKPFRVPAVASLRAHYTPRPYGHFRGMLELQPLEGVSLLTPLAQKIAKAWLVEQCKTELAALDTAIGKAAETTATRRAELRAKADKHMGLPFLRANGERIDKMLRDTEARPQVLDPVGDVKAKWAREPGDADLIEALRATCRAANSPKETTERRTAKRALKAILRQAKPSWLEARQAYANARREVDKGLRDHTGRRSVKQLAIEKFERRIGAR